MFNTCFVVIAVGISAFSLGVEAAQRVCGCIEAFEAANGDVVAWTLFAPGDKNVRGMKKKNSYTLVCFD